MKIGGIIDKISDFRVIELLLRSLSKPVILDVMERRCAIAGKLA